MTIPCTPYFLYLDRRLTGRSTLGAIILPYNRVASPRTETLIIMAHVWLAAAWVNMATVGFITSNYLLWYYVGIWGFHFVL